MGKKASILILIFISMLFIVSSCEDEQIDVNTASLEKLDEIYGVGPAKGQAIIDARPFETIDDLTNANGIGKATLEKIKDEGLACVESDVQEENNSEENNESPVREQDNSSENEGNGDDRNIVEISENGESNKTLLENPDVSRENKKQEKIKLGNPKDIKTEQNFEIDKKKVSFAGIIFLMAIIGLLLFIRSRRFNKNEFG